MSLFPLSPLFLFGFLFPPPPTNILEEKCCHSHYCLFFTFINLTLLPSCKLLLAVVWKTVQSLLGAFAELQNGLLSSSCLSVCPSVCLSIHLHGTIQIPLDGFSWSFISKYCFLKICQENSRMRKIKFHENLPRITGTLHEDIITFMISHWIFPRRQMFQTKSKHTLHVQYIYVFENCTVYEIMWKYMVEPDRPKMAI